MNANAYNRAFAVGYFYGRAYTANEMPVMPTEDLVFRGTSGFGAGLVAGREDFQEVDLPRAALSMVDMDEV
jgi:hypothetical protein